MVFESSGVEEVAEDVVGEVSKAQGDAALNRPGFGGGSDSAKG